MQNNPSVTPLTGNAVLTTNTISMIVFILVYLARTKGYEIDQDGQNLLINVLQQPFVGEAIVGVTWFLMTMLSRLRVYSELSVKDLTGVERPPV